MDVFGYLEQFASHAAPLLNSAFFPIIGLIGLFMIASGLMIARTEGKKGEAVPFPAVMSLVAGALLLSIPTFVEVLSFSLFAADSDPLAFNAAYSASNGDVVIQAIKALSAWIVFIGWIAVARGIMRFRSGPKSGMEGWVGSGITFIIAGVLCINFKVTALMVANSFGADVGLINSHVDLSGFKHL